MPGTRWRVTKNTVIEEYNKQLRALRAQSRLFLHAHSIGFEDPERQVPMSVSAPLPPELHAVVDALTSR